VSRKQLNLGILAHVDAGKTTLTERLLYEAGVIDAVGSVDAGTTQTDSLALERQRGITIKTAVASFTLPGGAHVNLIDTPGHPDFIAEVERALTVLDGAVLVVSAVEGVQPQTRILMRALQRLRVPTILFVNKTDRAGADVERVIGEMRRKLTPAVGDAYPVLAGSARTGGGVRELMRAIPKLLPAAAGDADAPVDGIVFKIERGPAGEKIAYVRMRAGTLRVRDRVRPGKVTALAVFEQGGAVPRPSVSPGEVAKVWGLADARIGDRLAEPTEPDASERHFPPPTFEAAVAPKDGRAAAALRVALAQLAEQDPLIGVRDARGELSVSLYGEVQKEVIEATLERDYGLAVSFREVTPICVERPAGRGEAVEVLHADTNPYLATIGLRVEPAPAGSGVAFRLAVDHLGVPLYAYKRIDRFEESMRQYVLEALREGLSGWEVVDCVVTMTESGYSAPDGPPSRRGPLSTPADFRKLTPIVLGRALVRAGTVVCEPMLRIAVEAPAPTAGAVLAALGQLGGEIESSSLDGELATVDALLPAARAHHLQRRLASVAHGEATVESAFGGYRRVAGTR